MLATAALGHAQDALKHSMQHLMLQKQAHGDLASPAEGKTLHVTREMANQGLLE